MSSWFVGMHLKLLKLKSAADEGTRVHKQQVSEPAANPVSPLELVTLCEKITVLDLEVAVCVVADKQL